MKKSILALCLISTLFACKKDKKDDIIPPIVKVPSHEMMITTTPQLNDLGWGTQQVYAFISDFEGNVMDFKELTAGTTHILSTGDPDMKYFDFHIISKATGQFVFTSGGSYHNVTGDTLYYGPVFNTASNSTHSTLTVKGLPYNMNETVFVSSTGGVDIVGGNGNLNELQCEIKDDSNDPMTMYLSLGRYGDETYRYYWNKSVPKFSSLSVQYDELTEVPPLVTMHFPQALDFEYLYVFGKPNEGTESHVLARSSIEGTNDVPIFIPKDFATDIYTDITANSGTQRFHSIIYSDEIPGEYVAPVTDFNVDATAGVGFNVTGSGFDTYSFSFSDANQTTFWSVIGPYEPTMTFKYPILTDDIKSILGIDLTQLTATPSYQSVTKTEPSVPYFYSLPSNNYYDVSYERRDIISKL